MPTDEERREVARSLRGDPCDTLIPYKTGVHFGMGYREAADRFWDMCERIKSAGDYDIAYSTRSVLADFIEPSRGSGGKTILCAHCENVSWCGCEPGDDEVGCDFEPSVTEGEPPYNLYSLYEAVFRRHPRDEYAIEDDEVEELVDALLGICNTPGNEYIQRKQPSEPNVRCVAEIKVDGEQLEKLAHDAAVELTGIDRDALLALADEMDRRQRDVATAATDGVVDVWCLREYADLIREACGEAVRNG